MAQALAPALAQVRMPAGGAAPEGVPAAIDAAVAHAFDLAAEIPFRVTLLRCSPREPVLVLVVHHIATDGSSCAPLARYLAAAYAARRAGRAPGWEPLPVQYKDYTLWQREVLGDFGDPDSLGARQVEYWREELAGVPQPPTLPLDRPRCEELSTDGDAVGFVVEPVVAAGLEKLAAEHAVTMSMVVQAALAVLLSKLGGGEDVAVGSPVAGRTDEAPADLVEELNPERSTAYRPLFQVMCGWQNFAKPSFDFPGPGTLPGPHAEGPGQQHGGAVLQRDPSERVVRASVAAPRSRLSRGPRRACRTP